MIIAKAVAREAGRARFALNAKGHAPPSGVNPARDPQRVVVIIGVIYEASKAGLSSVMAGGSAAA